MALNPACLGLYLCTDRALLNGRSLARAVEEAIAGGVTIVQLREKELSSREFYETAKEILAITKRRGVPLIINDRLDIALAAGANGVHLGQDDLPVCAARTLAGRDFIIGVSAHNRAEAVRAEQEGADYIGAGAVFATGTKADASVIGPEGLAEAVRAVRIPVVGIGGINSANIIRVRETGAAGAAVISAILRSNDIRSAAAGLVNK